LPFNFKQNVSFAGRLALDLNRAHSW
jgi:hypothetical protein